MQLNTWTVYYYDHKNRMDCFLYIFKYTDATTTIKNPLNFFASSWKLALLVLTIVILLFSIIIGILAEEFWLETDRKEFGFDIFSRIFIFQMFFAALCRVTIPHSIIGNFSHKSFKCRASMNRLIVIELRYLGIFLIQIFWHEIFSNGIV